MTDKIDKGMSMLNATDETVNPYGLRSGLFVFGASPLREWRKVFGGAGGIRTLA